MPAPEETLKARLPLADLPADPRRLDLLAVALQNRNEQPGQVIALFQSDCGLCRRYWAEIQQSPAVVWRGLSEVLVAQPRADLRRWVQAQRREAGAAGDSGDADLEVRRLNRLRCALIAQHLFADDWDRFRRPAEGDQNVVGVRTMFDRYLMMLAERLFLAQLGVLAVTDWFRAPVETMPGLDITGIRAAVEARWAGIVDRLPAPDADAAAWTAAHGRAGKHFPPAAEVEAQLVAILRCAGLLPTPDRPLAGAP